jgi:hypothetical protein
VRHGIGSEAVALGEFIDDPLPFRGELLQCESTL